MSNRNRDEAQDFFEGIPGTGIVASLQEGPPPPYLKDFAQSTVVPWLYLREEYDIRIKEYAIANSRALTKVYISWKSKVPLQLVKAWAEFEKNKEWKDVTEDEFKEALYEIRDRVVYSHTDVADVLKGKLKMNMKFKDPRQRVLDYFATARKIIDDNGLREIIGSDNEFCSKLCTILVNNLFPAPLKADIVEHLTYDQFKICKKDHRKLYQLVVTRAVKQQKRHDYAMKYHSDVIKADKAEKKRKPDSAKPDVATGKFKKAKANSYKERTKPDGDKEQLKPCDMPSALAKLKVFTDGCLGCGSKDHMLGAHTPAYSKIQKNHLWSEKYKKLGIPNPHSQKIKCLKTLSGQSNDDGNDQDTPKFTVKLNGVVQMPAIVDCGATSLPAVSRKIVNEILKLDKSAKLRPWTKQMEFETAGGHILVSKDAIDLKVEIQTVSGTISSYKPLTCCVIEEDEKDFLITNNMLKNIGINVDKQVLAAAASLHLPRELIVTSPNDGDDISPPRMDQPINEEN